ncbi:hypothetical protein J6590_031218 [Homalodisca vitripennis]|nr:hypothetical protein J6590_031218 [Homalodisca vitripennis]
MSDFGSEKENAQPLASEDLSIAPLNTGTVKGCDETRCKSERMKELGVPVSIFNLQATTRGFLP